MTFSDPTLIDAPAASSTAVLPAASGANSAGRASRRRDAGVLLVGVLVGVGISWAVVRAAAIYPRAVDRVASEIRLEVEKNHPELLKDVTPFIDCAVLRQKTTGHLFAYLADRSLLMPAFRSDVAFCAKAADELLAKSPKTPDANFQATDLALPPIVAPVVPLPDINATPAGSLTAMPALSPSFRPPPQQPIAPLATVAPGDQQPTTAGTNGIPQVFTTEPTGTLGPVVPPLGDLGGLITPAPAQSPLQVVKPPENH